MAPSSPPGLAESPRHRQWWLRMGSVVTLGALLLLLALAAWARPESVSRVVLAADCTNQLGPMSDFNVFLYGDMYFSNSTIEGRVAVGGNGLAQGTTSVGAALTQNLNRDDLIVAGNLAYA